jgi:hypothetical protein
MLRTTPDFSLSIPGWPCTCFFFLLLAKRELKHLPLNFGRAFERVLRVLS